MKNFIIIAALLSTILYTSFINSFTINETPSIYLKIENEDLEKHIEQLFAIEQDFKNTKFFTRENDECLNYINDKYNSSYNDNAPLPESCIETMRQGEALHTFASTIKNNSKYIFHDAGHTMFAIAKTAEYLFHLKGKNKIFKNLNIHSGVFYDAKHDIEHAYIKDLAS